MERKGELWNICLQKNVFENCRETQLDEIKSIFERIIEKNNNIQNEDFIHIMKNEIKQLTSLNYQDLIPKEIQPTIDFSDNIEETPIKDLDKLIEEKNKERILFNDLSSNEIVENINPIQYSENQSQSNNILLKKMEMQNKTLEKILLYQIKLFELLQKK
tara:strand:+ start:151 stop:630 length:480 start_codon:yes stop_codon:yes gene_type:complete